MIKVTFLRHAQTTANRDGYFAGLLDVDITNEGSSQASNLFKNKDFTKIYCSPLKRTIQTLHSFKPNVTPTIDNRIKEIDVGEWQGKLKSEIGKEKIKEFLEGKYLPNGAESIEETDIRIKNFIVDIFSNSNKDDDILVITHNGAIRSVKRLFPYKVNVLESQNLETFTIDENDYKFLNPQG